MFSCCSLNNNDSRQKPSSLHRSLHSFSCWIYIYPFIMNELGVCVCLHTPFLLIFLKWENFIQSDLSRHAKHAVDESLFCFIYSWLKCKWIMVFYLNSMENCIRLMLTEWFFTHSSFLFYRFSLSMEWTSFHLRYHSNGWVMQWNIIKMQMPYLIKWATE